MSKHKIQKSIALFLTFTLTGTMLPCSAANLVPFNGGKSVVPPSTPVTRPVVESNSSSDGFSIQSIKSKVSDIINPKKAETKLKDVTIVASGTCGKTANDDVSWQLNSDGVLTISGAGNMDDYGVQASYCINYGWHSSNCAPWLNYINSIKSITIGNEVNSIGNYAFSDCSALESVTMGNSITSIGNYAFYSCSSLKSVMLSDFVTSIGSDAFYGCSALMAVNIPNRVTSIGTSAFSGCTSLKSVTIPDSVTSIGNYAFEHCESITSITIPNSVTSIGSMAFWSCDSLRTVTLNSDYVVSKFQDVLYNQYIREIVLGDSVTAIGNGAFKFLDVLTSVTIPASVTSIGDEAFLGCTELETVNFQGKKEPASVGINIFEYCSKLKKVNVPADYEGSTFCGIAVKKPGDPVTPIPSSTTSSTSSKLSGGAIAGIVIGAVAAVAAATVGTVLLLKHKCVKAHPAGEVPA